ncbi:MULTISPECIES: hypothetical protein [unclassified Bradyrhizobium]|uniref:hypothetical protein n=1 Tax=unclassified Bradyrhizobium TaxID=2631580 RepID=UPI00247A0AC8|nr:MULTISPECIES: hypothetical protein [unclassified Bradyrhizobium]WGR68482.1 hypothetical protein MTX24_23945 [Bradyrhizobium sp. ISRA426]WGR80537.1 hypothetical protein MTX21_09060 [Bradyrhizobium sp. ISRA430]WGR83722.1 hypothetical protein MTX25_23625 [Bradyrhizobium sp. ISRA432]
MPEPDIRKGMPPVRLSRDEFESRYRHQFIDPASHRCRMSSMQSSQLHGTPTATRARRRSRGRRAADEKRADDIEQCVISLESEICKRHPSVAALYIKPQTNARYHAVRAKRRGGRS